MICINSITICPENITITKGKWYHGAYANICPTNATCQCVTWHSSNSDVASVNQNGYIFGVTEGTAVIYATAQDGSGAVGFCTVTVASPVKVSAITVTPSTKTVNVGDSFGLSATVCPTNADDKRIRWTSCDCSIADVDYLTGCVTAKSVGTTCICANAIDGSGVQGYCEVSCYTSGTDSIGVFRTLSMHSATPSGVELEAPVMLGVQFKEQQNGNYDIRFISQIKTLYYKAVGFEIHSKFGDDAAVSHILSSKIAYTSLIADGETIEAGEGNYFVLSVLENIPQNAVSSFKITPFAITLEREILHGSTMNFRFEGTQNCDFIDFETPEHLSTSPRIRVNTGNGSNLDLVSLPNENSTVLGQFTNEKEIALVIDTPQNGKWYAVYGLTTDGTYKFGWCDGKYLEEGVPGLIAVKDCYIRSDTRVDDSTKIRNPDNSTAIIREGNKIQLWESETISQNGSWYAVIYNKNKAFVTADDFSFDEITIWSTLPTHNICNIRVKSNGGTFVKSNPSYDATNIGNFSYHSEISLVDDRLTNENWYYVYGKTSGGEWTYGWCSAEDLEEKIIFAECIYNGDKDLNVREAAGTSGKFITGINCGRKIRILAYKDSTDSNGPWHKILYRDQIAYVIAGKNTDNFSADIKWFSMVGTNKKQYDIERMKNNLMGCDTSIINRDSVIDMFESLMSLGYEPAFVAGILANIQAEGEIGHFENSNSPNPLYYLEYMNLKHSYADYSNKRIYDFDGSKNIFTKLDIMLEALNNKNWENDGKKIGFGLGCLQWSFDRTYGLVQKYKCAKTSPETITKAETIQGEKMMIETELAEVYPNIKNCWENQCGKYLNTPLSAYRAGYELCKWYLKPLDTNSKAIVRGHLAESIYAVMMQ